MGNDLTDAGLVNIVRDMASGPANAPLKESEVDAESAYHRSLITHEPYLAVTGMKEGKWAGGGYAGGEGDGGDG